MSYTFETTLERDEEEFDIEVEYEIDGGDIQLLYVRRDGVDIDTTPEEDLKIYATAGDRAADDIADAAADYGDYLHDLRADWE
jgi:hypothetical protein